MSFWTLFIFGFATVSLLFKASPVLTDIGAVFNMDLDTVGWVSSVFAIAGLIVSFPGAWIMRKFGIKSTLTVTLVVTILGSLLGVFAPNAEMFLVSRALEGFGMGMISVVGPNVMLRLFPLNKQGLVMGIWSLWVPVGSILAFVSTPILYESFGWTSLWWASIALEVVAGALFLPLFKISKVAENVLEAQNGAQETGGKFTGKVYLGSAIAVGVVFTFWSLCYAGCINVFYPTYLQTALGFSIFESSLVPTIVAIITIPTGILFGIIADRTNTRKWFLAIGYFVFAIIAVTLAYTGGEGTPNPWIFAVILGCVAGAVPMATRAFIPVLVRDPDKVDYALAVMAFTTWLGQLLVGFYGGIVASQGFYGAALTMMLPMLVIAGVVVAICKSDKKILSEK